MVPHLPAEIPATDGGVSALAGIGYAPAAFARAPESEITAGEREAMAALANAYLADYGAPGCSVAIAHRGQLVYAEGFGLANPATGEKVTPQHLFRIASVSKPVTSVAIFSLIEQGRLKLDDKVFGKTGILRNDYGAPEDKRVEEITIEQLLTHTCGGWPNKGRDPMFSNPQFDQRRLIAWTLANVPLDHPPGTALCLFELRLLPARPRDREAQRPELRALCARAAARRCGVTQMRIGAGPFNERARNEVVYAGQGGDPYRVKVARADSCGGWIASPSDLVRFVTHVDGVSDTPSLLQPETIKAMTTPSPINPRYAKGWIVNDRAGGTTAACREPRP